MSKYSAAGYLNLSQKTKWYVIASRVSAVIYTNGSDHKFHFLDRLSNPQGCLREIDLDSDKPGRGFSSPGVAFHHSLDRRSKSHEQVAKRFARKIGRILERAQRENRFDNLVLVAEPHFLGLLAHDFELGVGAALNFVHLGLQLLDAHECEVAGVHRYNQMSCGVEC